MEELDNRVFQNQTRKARGLIYFSGTEKLIIFLAGIVAVFFVHVIIAVFIVIGIVLILVVHRRSDNHRYDHIDIMARKLGPPPKFSLCERDENYERFKPL